MRVHEAMRKIPFLLLPSCAMAPRYPILGLRLEYWERARRGIVAGLCTVYVDLTFMMLTTS